MQKRLGFMLILILTVAAACQVGEPPTQFVVEVTVPVPVTVVQTVVVTPNTPDSSVIDTTPIGTPTAASATVEGQTVPEEPDATATITGTPLPEGFPTPTVGQVYTAEQAFQNGRMFWLEPVGQIWVLTTDENENQVWLVYNDTWEEGMPETDDTLVPPEPGLQQPVRGFGKLWRENDDVRNLLGWAVDPELGFVTRYEFYHGGEMVDGTYVAAPGYHVLQAYNGDILVIDEATRTWSKVGNVRT
ncbi:hypothetical protein G4Y79_17785 [Phototrophicus methaneseepsis]|uniref:Uncharacterized protein n=1 Tax=Phototrophicus methaneseepsis TaxID=2710758 RepID=A0A7S8IDG9_9CHLR|nr:hypothetical protein [Phototrophicus methaneseepsis]QPC81526.1 hypothetical protein G4Y79_17785 [Phototrophicus methaneseepsis]